MIKAFDRHPRLAVVWRMAGEALAQAKQIIMIGFSFPMSDYYVRWLFRTSVHSGLRANRLKTLHVVDVDERNTAAVVERVISSAPEGFTSTVEVQRHPSGLDGYLEWARNQPQRPGPSGVRHVPDCFD
jgi:hypothetical protein